MAYCRVKFNSDNQIQEVWIGMDTKERQHLAVQRHGSKIVRHFDKQLLCKIPNIDSHCCVVKFGIK